jgi:hypothetical protein
MLLLPLLFWQFRGLISLGGVFGCVISEGPWVFVGLPNVVKVWQAFLIVFYITLNPICNIAQNKFTSTGVALTQFYLFSFLFLDCNFNMRHLCCSASFCNLCRQDGTAQLSIFSSILR